MVCLRARVEEKSAATGEVAQQAAGERQHGLQRDEDLDVARMLGPSKGSCGGAGGEAARQAAGERQHGPESLESGYSIQGLGGGLPPLIHYCGCFSMEPYQISRLWLDCTPTRSTRLSFVLTPLSLSLYLFFVRTEHVLGIP